MHIVEHKLLGDDDRKVKFIPSPHVRPGKLQHRFVLIHGTEGHNMGSTVSHFADKNAERSPSAHLVIGRKGEIVQMVPFDRIAKHGERENLVRLKMSVNFILVLSL
jgi:N-acetylmuramoyl-L-alanine amidase